MNIEILEKTYDDMVDHYLKLVSEEFLEAKKNIFIKDINSVYNERGFLDWVICDEKIDYSKIENDENRILVDGLKKSYLSIFETISTENNGFLKDIFTKEDFLIVNFKDLIENTIYVGRLVKIEDGNYYFKAVSDYDKELKNNFYSGILKKYNEKFKAAGSIGIKEFINENPIIIYKFINIYDEVALSNDDEEYYVYQSEYIFPDRKIIEVILDEKASFVESYDDQKIYELFITEISFVEVVVLENRIEIEAISEDDLADAKKIIEDIFSENVKHLRDTKLFIDDLI